MKNIKVSISILNVIIRHFILCVSLVSGSVAGFAQQQYDSYKGLVMAGYQGWFNAPDDGADRGWYHYKGREGFKPNSSSVDFWADVSEYESVYKTEFHFKDESPAYTFSSYDASTVNTHFRWMREYGIDGVFMQRFVVEIAEESGKNHFDKVLDSAMKAANVNERAISVMYDLSGMTRNGVEVLLKDAKELMARYDLLDRKKYPSYLYHNGKPLIAVWGIGFNDNRSYGFKEARQIIDGLKKMGYSILIGVPTFWRELKNDTLTDKELHRLIKKCDIILPWFVGRYNEDSYPLFEKIIKDDIIWCKANHLDYVPLCFPGFSWANLKGTGTNKIDRNNGSFLWKQIYGALSNGAEMLYIAMFDEIDEGTAIFKCLQENRVPLNGNSMFQGIEKELDSDYYLWLTGEAAKCLRKEKSISVERPTRKPIVANTPITLLDLRSLSKLNMDDSCDVKKIWDELHTISTLQGIINREYPQLYINYIEESGKCIDEYWWNKYRANGEWLADKDTLILSSVMEAIRYYANRLNGLVVYDPNVFSTSNVASAIAGIDNLLAVRYDTDPASLYSQIQRSGLSLPEKVRLVREDGSSLFTGTGMLPGTNIPSCSSLKNDPYRWFIEKYMKAGKCNTEYAAYYIDQYWRTKPKATVSNHHTLTNHDFFVSKKAFFFDLSPWGDEPATDDLGQVAGTDLETLQCFLHLAYDQNKGEKLCYIGGFPSWAFKYTQHAGGKHDDVPTEWEFSRIISAYNAFKDADAIGYGALANASFWQHFPLKKQYKQKWIDREELKQRGLLTSDGKVNCKNRDFIIFYVGDYDASSWIAQRTPSIWDDPNRGKVPLMWCISPVLQERMPMVLHNFRNTATPNDYFASADNGAGYLMPGMLQEPRPLSGLPSGLDAWAAHCKHYYKQWDLTITGFVIDGYGPGLNEKGLDCYASFSPNGIIPQKIPLTLLHKGMPVLRSDADVNDNDPKKAASLIVERVNDRSIPFHWFRNILKTPTWYVQVVKEIRKLNPNIELLDAPAFFELYRIYLEQNPNAAKGEL